MDGYAVFQDLTVYFVESALYKLPLRWNRAQFQHKLAARECES